MVDEFIWRLGIAVWKGKPIDNVCGYKDVVASEVRPVFVTCLCLFQHNHFAYEYRGGKAYALCHWLVDTK